MYKDKTFLAIIPARGGSKRLPRKNILDLAGKPLIVHSIEAGLNSKYIDKVIVTSDDEEILKISNDAGASTIIRPTELANDTAKSFDAIKHTIDQSKNYDYIVLLQPTSPLRSNIHIDEAIESLITKQADAIISVCEMDHNPLWSNTLPSDGNMSNFLNKDILNQRSQDLDIFYRINGAIYICNTTLLKEQETFFIDNKIYSYIMDKESSVDIDEEIDFLLAQTILNMKKISNE